MGLDIYLYDGDLNLHFCDTPETPKNEGGWRERKDWHLKPERAHAKSQKYPEHYCERTYLRSSYNDSGFNSVVRNLIGRDWHDVFGPTFSENIASPHEDDGEGTVATERLTTAAIKAELRLALDRARILTHDLKAVRFPLGVMAQSPALLGNIADVDEEEAVRIVTRELERDQDGGYGNRDGEFFGSDPLKVVGLVRGKGFFGPVIHVVYQRDLTWYIQASEIAEEFIDYALTLDDPRISWSG